MSVAEACNQLKLNIELELSLDKHQENAFFAPFQLLAKPSLQS